MPSYRQYPQVMMTTPGHDAKDIATTLKQITIGFNIDLDKDHIEGNVELLTKEGTPVDIDISYDHRMIKVDLLQELIAGTEYTLRIYGDDDFNETDIAVGTISGIRTISLDDDTNALPMPGIHFSSFTTAEDKTLPPPKIIYPEDQSKQKSDPGFLWTNVSGASSYEIIISHSNTMENIIWPKDRPHYVQDTQLDHIDINDNEKLSDGLYYWQIRAIAEDGQEGKWSKIQSFYVDTVEEGKVSEEDDFIDFDPYEDNHVEILEVFPKDHASNIKTNLNVVYVKIMGSYTKEDVKNISIHGESWDEEQEDHGEIGENLQAEIVEKDNMTTTIALYLDPIE